MNNKVFDFLKHLFNKHVFICIIIFTVIGELLNFNIRSPIWYFILALLIPFFKNVYNECVKKALKPGYNNKKELGKLLDNKNFRILCSVLFVVIMSACLSHIKVYGNILQRLITQTDVHTENETDDNLGSSKEETYEIFEKKDFLSNPDLLFQLNQEEKNKIYFLTGEYMINDWYNSGEIKEIVRSFINDLKSKQLTNEFDSYAPEELKDDISNASEKEKNMINSDDLDDVIDIRISAYNQYPKSSLAKLIAHNHQQYALEYTKAGGHFETVEYYYSQSIMWLFNRLQFKDIDKYITKQILASLEMRYNDIAEYVKTDSVQKERAKALSKAFRSLKNE